MPFDLKTLFSRANAILWICVFRFDYIHVVQILYSIDGRIPSAICDELYLWKHSVLERVMVFVWTETTI